MDNFGTCPKYQKGSKVKKIIVGFLGHPVVLNFFHDFCGFHFGFFTYLLTWSTLFLTKKFLKHIDKVLITCLFLTQYEKVIIFRHKQTLFVIHGGSQLIFKMFRYVASSVFNKQGGLAPKDLEPSLFIYQAVQLAKSDKTSTNNQIAPHSFNKFFLCSRIYNEEFFLRFRILPSVAFYFISPSFSFSLIPLTCFFSQGTCYWELLVDVAPQQAKIEDFIFFAKDYIFFAKDYVFFSKDYVFFTKDYVLFAKDYIFFSKDYVLFVKAYSSTAKDYVFFAKDYVLFGKDYIMLSLPRIMFSSQRTMFSLPRIMFSSQRIMFSLPRIMFSSPRIMFFLPRIMFSTPRILVSMLRITDEEFQTYEDIILK